MSGTATLERSGEVSVTAELHRLQVPGPEMEAIRRFHVDGVWTGRIVGGPRDDATSLPEFRAAGRATFTPIMGGLWIVGEIEQDDFIYGEKAGEWKCHYVVGWSPAAGEYRAVAVDSNGNSQHMRGLIDGDQFVLETLGYAPVRVRMTWDMHDPDRPLWFNESSVDGGPWKLIEEYDCTPL